MLKLIGVRKDVSLEIREKMAISRKNIIILLQELRELFQGIVILSTCNRTEIYFNDSFDNKEGLKKIFDVIGWDKDIQDKTFLLTGEEVVKHLFQVISGFHSKILGEDQILSQIKEAYSLSKEYKATTAIVDRLFQDAISCGKKFRSRSKLYEIPVSSASVAVNKSLELGAKSIMVIGYGVIGKLVIKYCINSHLDEIILVVRDKDKITELEDKRIKILNYHEARDNINFIDAVISCTSAPHVVVKKDHINKLGKNIALIDLALPRDIDKELKDFKRVILYDIDDISKLDSENKSLRIERMKANKFIIHEYIEEFLKWLQMRDLSTQIINFKIYGEKVVDERVKSFQRRCNNDEDLPLIKRLIRSTSDYYINRAIKVLKEEKIKGSEDECLRILEKIFMMD